MNPNCARCGKIVYPTEKVNCLDKSKVHLGLRWQRLSREGPGRALRCLGSGTNRVFHCETCKMTLNMKNYKGYEKKPYCNA
ncbi:hypothetical protein DUI87_21819 [Hirundo rustica rustica]|uniref:LIM zinc-binding domain-containing protein n=1 Tax=Hirundo rustica rustica TaxID=333673 RepID=A0A3M0JM49_HIRRU|nr:hypothetical protein DUI87_21819 [Hirundo rustica rustica]